MKVITATLRGKLDNDYAFDGIKLAFCTSAIKRHVKQISDWVTCREDMMKSLRFRVNGRSGKIDIRRTRLLVYTRARYPSGALKDKEKHYTTERKHSYVQLQASLKLIQHFERRLGWPLTRVYKVDHMLSPLASIYVVVGSSRWQKSTHYLSLYLLMLRLGRSGFQSKFEDHKELEEELATFVKKRSDDAGFVKGTYHKWELFLQNQDKLFAGRNLKHIFKKSSLADDSNGYAEGISQLCVGWSRDLALNSRFKKLCEANGLEQKEKVVATRKAVAQNAINRR